MTSVTTPQSYHPVAKFIHWLTALLIISLLALGWTMDNFTGPSKFTVFQLHKSLGISVLLLSIIRLGWRLTHRAPPLPISMKISEKFLAHSAHVLFYILILVMPFTGWALVSTAQHRIPTVLFGLIPWPSLTFLSNLENRQEIHETFGDAHNAIAYIIFGLLILHVAAALKHHFVSHDDILTRMAPRHLTNFLNRLNRTKVMTLLLIGAGLSFSPTASAKTWTIDYNQSHLDFTAVEDGKPFSGSFKKFQISSDFDPDHPETSRIQATIDITSVNAGDAERNSYLPQSDWFDIPKFPEATFVTTSIQSVSSDNKKNTAHSYLAKGTLTLKGITKPVDLTFVLTPDGDHFKIDGKASLIRTDYNVGTGQWSDDSFIKHAVDLSISLIAKPN